MPQEDGLADLSLLDLHLPRMRETKIDRADIPALIAAERAGKARKSVLAYLESLLRPAFVAIGCIVRNVHLGDGRQLGLGGRAWVPREVAELLVANRQAVNVC
jgi:hypothetical protein